MIRALLLLLLIPSLAQAQGMNGGGAVGGKAGDPPPPPPATTCTDGVDCFCDRVETGGPDAPTVGTTVHCVDWEDPRWYIATGDPIPNGEWYDPTGGNSNMANDRGGGNRWHQTYSGGAGATRMNDGRPTGTPYFGDACDTTGTTSGSCNGKNEYCSVQQGEASGLVAPVNGCWGSPTDNEPNTNACMDMQRAGDCDEEIPGLGCPATPVDNGLTWYTQRNRPAGIDNNFPCGDLGGTNLGFDMNTFSVTIAYAHPSNIATSDIMGAPWKYDEWDDSGVFPNDHWIFPVGATGAGNDCEAKVAGIGYGFPYCPTFPIPGDQVDPNVDPASQFGGWDDLGTGSFIKVKPDPLLYDFATDYALGDWHCVQGYVQDWVSTDTRIRIWHNGSLVTDLIGWNTTQTTGGVNRIAYNNYSNINQCSPQNCDDTSLETTYRYQDNMVVVNNGPPIQCSVLGFDSVPDITP